MDNGSEFISKDFDKWANSLNKELITIDKLWVIVLFIIFQVYTYIRYLYKEKHSVDVIKIKWLSKKESYRKQTSFFLVLYGVISIIGFFGLALL